MYYLTYRENETSGLQTILYFSLDEAINMMDVAKQSGFLMGDVWKSKTGKVVRSFRN